MKYMEEVSLLAKALKAHLPWHQARIIFLAQFILSLIVGAHAIFTVWQKNSKASLRRNQAIAA